MVYFKNERNRLVVTYFGEQLWIEAWGRNSLRVRGTKEAQMPSEDWALTIPQTEQAVVTVSEDGAEVTNGDLTAKVSKYGWVTFVNHKTGKTVLEEYWRFRVDDPDISNQGHGGTEYLVPKVGCATQREGREYHPILGGNYGITARFESEPNERIYGMGQYQQPYLNLKNTVIDMSQRNSQACVPFMISDLGYGFLWNNPSIGQVEFCKNMTVWSASCSRKLDYWLTVGDSPAEIEERYGSVTGTVPMMPDWAMGFWQCKLRYQTQEELLEIAREHKRRGLPLDVIVADFFHWPKQGEWKFDPEYWPDPKAMVDELEEMGVKLMVSVWPVVDYRSENYKEMKAKGYLLRNDRGFPVSMNFMGNTIAFDAFNPDARAYVWNKCRENYYNNGVRIFWLDEAEPEFTNYDCDIVRNYAGPHLENGNFYPVVYAKAFYEGMQAEGQDNIINLLRCAWAGSQKYGALTWSGDIYSTFESMRCQVTAGLNMAIAGIPWWTTDIGGFIGGRVDDPAFHELFVRWFAYGCFCPVMRSHGNRVPQLAPIGTSGGGECPSGSPNEVWSYGEKVYNICRTYLELRRKLKPYIKEQMRAAHEKGTPVMRPLFYDFPDDPKAWDVETAYMFGPDILVSPVTEAGVTEWKVYLPAGEQWVHAWTGDLYEGGQTVTVRAPLEEIPYFNRVKKN